MYSNAWIAGICFMVSCFFMLITRPLYEAHVSFLAQFLVLVLSILIFFGTLVWHIAGYITLAREGADNLLLRSTQTLEVLLIVLGISVIASVCANTQTDPAIIVFANAGIGLMLLLLAIPWLVFAYALLRRYQTLGIGVAGAVTVLLAVFFMWTPWLPLIAAAVSTTFFYRRA